jgi:hypothetical protein
MGRPCANDFECNSIGPRFTLRKRLFELDEKLDVIGLEDIGGSGQAIAAKNVEVFGR